jgi:5'-3' exonuclease
MGPILLIDAYNIFARNYVVNPSISKQGEPIGGSIGFCKSIGLLAHRFRPSKIIVCWEGGGSKRRRDIYPGYKAGRKPLRLNRSELYEKDLDSPENFMHQVNLSVKLLNYLPVMQMYVDDCEADDVIGWLARHKFAKEEREVIIVSSDQDMLQLLRPGVKQYTPTGKKMLTHDHVVEKYGISCENFVTARCFIGDSSDKIFGIRGIGFKTMAKKFPNLAKDDFVSVNEIIKECQIRNKTKQMKLYERILETPDVPRLNWRLMYLDISNLSAEHIKQLHYRYDNATITRDKMGFMRTLIHEGVEIPRQINADMVYMRLTSTIGRE